MVGNSVRMGKVLEDNLKSMKSPIIKDVRARGLFQAMEFQHDLKHDGNKFAKILFKNGLITKATHEHVIRFAPALVINEQEVHEASEIIEKSLREFEAIN